MSLFITILAAILAIFIVILIHELGHYWVARLCGIRVLKFSIGFGKALWKTHTKSGTEFAISVIPLGGFVKMLGDGFESIDEKDKPFSYAHQSVWARMAVVAAGPLINFLMAILLFWFVFLNGSVTVKPVVGEVIPHTPAARAGLVTGDQIVSMGDSPIDAWSTFTLKTIENVGRQTVPLKVKNATGQVQTKFLNLSSWAPDPTNPNLLESLGFYQYLPKIPAVIEEVTVDSPAAKAGLKKGDKLLSINGRPYSDWQSMVKVFQHLPNQTARITVQRGEQVLPLTAELGSHEVKGKVFGFLGILPVVPLMPKSLLITQHYSVVAALGLAVKKTYELTRLNIVVLSKLFAGELSVKVLGGPITIFQGAGYASHYGWLAYLSFVAFINVALGFVNLLPIPGLDGGHLVFLAIEAIKRKPLSLQVQSIGIRLGFTALIMLMLLATYNDLVRVFFSN